MSKASTIALRNPRIVQVLHEETAKGAGRNATETAENLILDGVEYRKAKRDAQKNIREGQQAREPAPAA